LEINISEGDDEMGSEIFGVLSSIAITVYPACTAPQNSEVLWLVVRRPSLSKFSG
ncbi:944_t:CDS:1, partial [Gigaspora rosea]